MYKFKGHTSIPVPPDYVWILRAINTRQVSGNSGNIFLVPDGFCKFTVLKVMKKLYSNPIIFAGVKALVYSALMVFLWYLMLYDSLHEDAKGKFGETSYTEFAQEIFLLISGIIYLVMAKKFPNVRGFAILLAGFCFTALIREYNNYFHAWFKGAWQILAFIIVLLTAFAATKNRSTILRPVHKYLNTPAFGITLSALLIVLVFSRLYGLHNIWYNILQEDLTGPYRWVKNASEEGTELLGYCLFFIGAVEYFLRLHKKSTGKKAKRLS